MVHTHQGYEHYARERVREATAVYFEWLAQKETHDYDRRQRLSEVARFYRSLAGIIPAMPTQERNPDLLCERALEDIRQPQV